MPLEPGLIAYAGLASLAAARSKHWPARRLPAALSPSMAKVAGVLLLLLSSVIAFQRFGAAQGAVAWTGQLCVAGVALVLLMSWRFDTALKLGIVALMVALALLSLGSR
jgi:uncharacterized membrane protein